MQTQFAKTGLTIIFLAIGISVFGQTLKGKIVDGNNNVPFAPVWLIDHFKKRVIASATSDFEGKFKFEKPDVLLLDLSISQIGYGDTTVPGILLVRDTLLVIDIHRPCKYDRSKKDNTCPVCHKKNNVVPIVYGLLISDKKEKVEEEDFYPGGCVISSCDPNWYCKLDKTKF